MIIFTILLIAVIALAIIGLALAIASGAGFMLAFGDIVVFGLIVWLIIKIFRRKKK